MKSSIDGTGSVTQDVYVARKFNQREKEIMSAVRYDDGKVGVILGAKNSVSLYTEEATNGLLDIKDLNNILFENSNSNTQYIINRSSKKYILFPIIQPNNWTMRPDRSISTKREKTRLRS